LLGFYCAECSPFLGPERALCMPGHLLKTEQHKSFSVGSLNERPVQFETLFCNRFNCQSSEYLERAFRKVLYKRARLAAPLIRKLNPSFFDEDFKFISYLGDSTSLREANACAAEFQDANAARPSFLRRRLKIRASGLKAVRLACELF
jgi:hypothetical protein